MLVADPGGHLAVLDWLRPALAGWRRTWVTLDQLDARGRVGADPVIFGFGPTARAPLVLLRNLAHARRVLPGLRPDLVLSSGAGLGVPWTWAATRPTAWLEVGDRTTRPSLSLRLVRPVVDHLLVQSEAARAFRGDAIELGPVLPPSRPAVARDGPVLVALGTGPHPFERLVRAAEALAAAGEDVLVQHGASRAPRGCRSLPSLPPDAFRDAMARARVVVVHGGLATRHEARALGRVPVVVPRRADLGEHVDDHQQAARHDQAPVVDAEQLVAFLRGWSEPTARPASSQAVERFAAWLDQAVPSV